MRYFEANTADLVWQKAATELIERPDHRHDGRNGLTREILPCTLKIEDPRKRWILSRYPPYNPAFGLVEFIWILTGNNESQVLNYWNPILPKYVGYEDIYPGAYGYRLRYEFEFDQIERAYNILLNTPETRQVILQIWKPDIDLPRQNGLPTSSDIPCNIASILKIRNGHLYWSQIMRSNDIMRGLPYNIIQFTLLQEIMASWLGVELGHYFHLSDSLHIYEKDILEFRYDSVESKNTYNVPFSMSYEESNKLFAAIYKDLIEVTTGKKSEKELEEIFDRTSSKNNNLCEFVKDILAIIGSDAAVRQNYYDLAYSFSNSCSNTDLKRAANAWLKYREG